MKPPIDPILLEVFKNAFDAIADEMALILMRTAYSPIVRDSMDYSTALCDASGQNLAQGLTTPMHLGSFYDAMAHLIAQYAGAVEPGDVFVGNDPYLASGQHLPDVYVIKPIFAGSVLAGWATTIAHHADVGGMVPGSNSIGATEIYQEGLRLPFLKLVARGSENRDVWQIIEANVRVPEQVLGDLRAQVAACRAGERGLLDLVLRHGIDAVLAYGDELQDYAERLTRAGISDIPDGRYEFTHHIDGLGENPEPIRFHVVVDKRGDEMIVDWSGTSAQVKGGINAPLSFTKSNTYAAIRSILAADTPNAHGYTRPIKVIAPPGTIVNCTHPAPCGARGITGYRIADCMFGALAQAVPDKVAADGAGGSTLPSFGGYRAGSAFVFSECVMGTWGATSEHDGQEGVPHMASNQSNVPIEMIEAAYPIRIERYGFVPDTGGAGKYRGGLAVLREYRVLQDDTYFGVRSDKRRFRPYGLFGGMPGAASQNVVVAGERERPIPTLALNAITMNANDVFRHQMSGGGGYGDPLERDPERVLQDVLDDKVTLAGARESYGVVIDARGAPRVDEAATRDLRARRRAQTTAPATTETGS
jgi:N-methylhydantoinase B